MADKVAAQVAADVLKRCEGVRGAILQGTPIPLCAYCTMRFACVRNISLFQLEHAVLVAGCCPGACEPAECLGCGGLLERCHHEDFQTSLAEAVKNCDYQFGDESYILNVFLPLSMPVRQHAIWLCLKDAHPEVFSEAACEGVVVDIKEAMKWVLGPYLDRNHGMHFELKAPFKVEIRVDVSAEENTRAEEFLKKCKVQNKGGRGKQDVNISLANIGKLMSGIKPDVFKKHVVVPPKEVPACTWEFTFSHESVFVAGRYNKYSQKLSQTPWLVAGGERMVEGSVEELVSGPLKKYFGTDKIIFSASGREDVDVRMLGNGRPFAVEFVDPHIPLHTEAEFAAMQEEVNKSTELIQIAHLQNVTVNEIAHLKEAETSKIKHYRALVWTSRPLEKEDLEKLESMKDIQVKQKTPIRVLHRRTLATRDKVVYSLRTEQLSPQFMALYLVTSAGTYIKEFVHGDLGRTQPNVGSILGCEADILQLDVMAVETEFPKPIRPVPELPHTFSVPESFIIADRERHNTDSPPEKKVKV